MYPKNYNPDDFVSQSGERYKIEYIGEPDEYGDIYLVEVGKTDLVEFHNRDASMNDVNILYERFCNGDVTALSQRQGSYFDTFGMPKDLRGMYDTIHNFETAYINLPEDVKKKYSFEEFLDNAGSEEWIKKFTTDPAKQEVEPTEIDNN